MLDLELRGEFGDVMERTLYNNVLAGMSQDGTKFFYVNPLEVTPPVARRRYDCHYVKTERVGWFGCACCPPNIARTLASLGYYAYSRLPDGLAIHLYASGAVDFTAGAATVSLNLRTDYPWDGEVTLSVTTSAPVRFALRLRLPAWCRTPQAAVNGAVVDLAAASSLGYLLLDREWRTGDVVRLIFPMPVERIRAHPRVTYDAGCVALQRGPVVFCAEQADNGPQLGLLVLPKAAPLQARFDAGTLGGTMVIEGPAMRVVPADDRLYSTAEPTTESATLKVVPYCLWNNRGEGEMRIWIKEC
jgi:hypothetical protein